MVTASTRRVPPADADLSGVVGARLLKGLGANAYGQAVSTLILFGSTPLLLSAWGSQKFGLWLVISAIPGYFALADLGFSIAAANDMTLKAVRSARGEACATFQSLLAFHALAAVTLIVAAGAIVMMIPARVLPSAAGIGGDEIRVVWLLQTLQVAAALFCGALGGGFQASGRYALGVVLASSARLIESVALTFGAYLFDGFAGAAALMLAARLIALFGMGLVLSRAAPWLPLGFSRATAANLRRLVGPALAVFALPAAFALSLQGFVLVIGATLSLEAVALFSAVRTLTRAAIQIAGIVNHAIMPELTRAFGAGDSPRVHQLVRASEVSVLAINLAALALLAVMGRSIVALWTRGRLTPDSTLVIGLAVVASLHSYWLSQSNLLLAVNRQHTYAYVFLAVSLLTLAGAAFVARNFGLDGLLLPLVVGEGVMAVTVARAFRATFGPWSSPHRPHGRLWRPGL